MTELHQTATDLAKVEAEYNKALARLAGIKATRRIRRHERLAAIAAALVDEPAATNVEVAARFAVTEGTVRNVRRGLATPTS